VLYSDEASRPNIAVNVLVGLETLKAGFGWSDEEMDENFCFDLQVRRVLGYRQLDEGHFELRTMYNFRQRLSNRMQTTGEDLLAQAFAQVTDEQVVAFSLKRNKLLEENGGADEEGLRPRQGEELSAASLQAPDDGVASYRQKRGEDFIGYVANLAETCHPDNPFQWIMDVQTEPNTTDDAAMLAESLPRLKEHTGAINLTRISSTWMISPGRLTHTVNPWP
jgi:hypothetical protein